LLLPFVVNKAYHKKATLFSTIITLVFVDPF